MRWRVGRRLWATFPCCWIRMALPNGDRTRAALSHGDESIRRSGVNRGIVCAEALNRTKTDALEDRLEFGSRPTSHHEAIVTRTFSSVVDQRVRFGQKKLPALRGRTVVNLFFEDSTRTRISFEAAAKRLSADVINFAAKGSSCNCNCEVLSVRAELLVRLKPPPGSDAAVAATPP